MRNQWKCGMALLCLAWSGVVQAAGGEVGANGISSIQLIGPVSTGVAAGDSSTETAHGGDGADLVPSPIQILEDTTVQGVVAATHGAVGGVEADQMGEGMRSGGGGAGGHGSASAIGAVSTGGAGGQPYHDPNYFFDIDASRSANGGRGGNITGSHIELQRGVKLLGQAAGAGGQVVGGDPLGGGGGGAGGHGGGSVIGGISTGGSGGGVPSEAYVNGAFHGGLAGSVTGTSIRLDEVTLQGAAGGNGGNTSYGGGGAAGHGGGSVFGGISTGGSGGSITGYTGSDHGVTTSYGGSGGNVVNSSITITKSILDGSLGIAGQGGAGGNGGGGGGGHAGGSVFGGVSTGGAGGYGLFMTPKTASYGGKGGDITGSKIHLSDTTLIAPTASNGSGGKGGNGDGLGLDGLRGGSVYGGVSTGGAGGFGYSDVEGSANGGNGGDITGNMITLEGTTSIAGDIYGGISRGGKNGFSGGAGSNANGVGGRVENNTVTLVGRKLSIVGGVYGGMSLGGDGVEDKSKDFLGNTLRLDGYAGEMRGIFNFNKYQWILPKDIVANETLVKITGVERVQLDNTQHTFSMHDDGKRMQVGSHIILIDQVEGTPSFASDQVVQQGHFILYDATLSVQSNQLLLTFGKDGTQSAPDSAGRINPTSKAFLEGRSSNMALINQSADLISEKAMAAAIHPGRSRHDGVFMVTSGGMSRYHTGSHIDVRDVNVAIGAANDWLWKNARTVSLGAFVEYGKGRYESYNDFGATGVVRGRGDTHYNGVGVLMHVAGLDRKHLQRSIAVTTGPYFSAAFRVGRTKNTFDSPDLVDTSGLPGRYASRSSYTSLMAGGGYVWNVNQDTAFDIYGRLTLSRLGADTVMVGNTALDMGRSQSQRLRWGARYSAVSGTGLQPYAGIAVEREFKGDASGVASGLALQRPTLRGTTGLVELGVSVKPRYAQTAISLDMGLQGYVGKREGVAGALKLNVVF